MKKIIAVLLCTLIFIFSAAPCIGAYTGEREYFDDGSYIIVSDEIIGNDYENGESGSEGGGDEAFPEGSTSQGRDFLTVLKELIRRIIALFKRNKTVRETKYVSYYSSDGDLLWMGTLTAEFTYNGKGSVCESAESRCQTYDSDWRLLSKDCTADGSNASACFRLRQYKLGVPLKTVEKTVSLSCDKDGNVK